MTKKEREPIIPDDEAVLHVLQNPEYRDRSDAEKHRLAQADTLLRLFKVESLEEMRAMACSEGYLQVIADHNAKMRRQGHSG